MSQPPRNRQPDRREPNRPQQRRRQDEYPPQRAGRYQEPPRGNYQQRPRSVQPQRDPFPYIMGGLIGAMVVGLALVLFLLLSNRNNPTTTPIQGNNNNPGTSNTAVVSQPTDNAPPRMTMDEFHALYANPATRPVVLDVRPAAAFAEGHIAGAISVPEAEVDVKGAKIPRDKLVIAYCQ